MSPLMTAHGIDKLSIDDRLQLVEEIWDSISSEPNLQLLTQAQIEDIDRRLAERDDPRIPSVSWEDLKASLKVTQ